MNIIKKIFRESLVLPKCEMGRGRAVDYILFEVCGPWSNELYPSDNQSVQQLRPVAHDRNIKKKNDQTECGEVAKNIFAILILNLSLSDIH